VSEEEIRHIATYAFFFLNRRYQNQDLKNLLPLIEPIPQEVLTIPPDYMTRLITKRPLFKRLGALFLMSKTIT
jgi:hypothetical protein